MSANEVRRGIIYTLRSKMYTLMEEDADKIRNAFVEQNFEFDDEVPLSSKEDLRDKIRERRGSMKEGELHLLYIIAGVENYKMVDGHGNSVEVREICEDLKGTGARIMILLELISIDEEDCWNIALNEDTEGDESTSLIGVQSIPKPHSTDMLLAYLPKQVGDGESSVEFFCKEMKRSSNMNELLAAVTKWAKDNEGKHIPMYSSTMREQIVLLPSEEKGKEERYLLITGGKTLAFLVEDFRVISRKWKCRIDDFNEEKNEENVRAIFERVGLEVELKRGRVNRSELLEKVEKAVEDQRQNPSPFLAILISSHGTHGGCVFCSDDEFILQDVLQRISSLEQVRKLIIVDACRGCFLDKSGTDHESPLKCPKMELERAQGNPGGESKKCINCEREWKELDAKLPVDTLLVTTTTEGNMAYALDGEALLPKELSRRILESTRGEEVDVFHILHDATREIAAKHILVRESPHTQKFSSAKMQVAFLSTLTKPLRFRVA